MKLFDTVHTVFPEYLFFSGQWPVINGQFCDTSRLLTASPLPHKHLLATGH